MLNIQEANKALTELVGAAKFERLLQTAAIITDLLMQHGIKPIIVGGLSVEIYTLSGYSTEDIDFVLSGYDKTGEILEQLGFQKLGKNWLHPTVGVSVEVPSNLLAGDYNKVTELQVDDKRVYVIGLEDIVLDRLRKAVHWNSGRDREWGYRLLLMYLEKLELSYMASQFENDSERAEFQIWLDEAANEKNQKPE
ncbi:hypothetical protein [Cohnella silvisoli]|uniref:UbiD family decarboxylase n=1 Tax=Cohnella silvisoli TaxID=2873699 RepID=A0ABV1L3R0_9BACL|nr:hypothetical protein [Cohnella silvisoli]MCD9026297.1 hypothetical protein [Cohnella silvisoli]